MTYLYRQAPRNTACIEFPFFMEDARHTYGLAGDGTIRWQSYFESGTARWSYWVEDYWDDTNLIDETVYGSAPSAATSWAVVDDINGGDCMRSSWLCPKAARLKSVSILYTGENSDEDGDTWNFVLSQGSFTNHTNGTVNMAHAKTFSVTGGEDPGGERAYFYTEEFDVAVAAADLLMLTAVRSSILPASTSSTDSDMFGSLFLTVEFL